MAIRISGISSGMDTDSMVQELVKASSTKKDNLVKAQTKLGWKQESWKALNTKVKTFFNSKLKNLKYESAFNKKKTIVADSSIASVITSDNAVNGTQSLAVKQLAKSGYLTGGKLSNDKSVTAKTTLSELTGKSGTALGEGDKISLRVKNGSEETILELSGASTINDVINGLKSAGISANFDETNQRIFVGAGNSGKDNDFSINAGNLNGLTALMDLGLVSASDLDAAGASKTYGAYQYWAEAYEQNADGTYTLNDDVFQQKVKETTQQTAAKLLEELKGYEDTVTQLRSERAKLTTDEDKSANYLKSERAQKTLADAANVLKDYYKGIMDSDTATEEEKAAAQEGFERASDAYETAASAADKLGIELPQVASYNLSTKVLNQSRDFAEVSLKALTDTTISGASATSVRIEGQNGLITLNGAEFESDTNNFSVNGLTITANNTSAITGYDANGNAIYSETTINTEADVDGIYNMIKDFLKDYNELIKEMDTSYNADSAKDYEPLTDEEKDGMSDTEIEKWEQKIKDSLLRRDSDLNTLINSFKTTMLGSYEVNGKKYSLASFGISTLGYFDAAENERGVYHIDGDADDSDTSGKTDVLKAMITNDPETVKSFFTSLVGDLYDKVNTIMTHTDYRSVYSVYDDKRLQTEYDDYTKKIKEQEEKLADLEDRYYQQFASMETALSKLNSQQSYISSLFGG